MATQLTPAQITQYYASETKKANPLSPLAWLATQTPTPTPTPVSGLTPELKNQQELLDKEFTKITTETVPTRVNQMGKFLTEMPAAPEPPSMVETQKTLREQYALGADETELANIRTQIANITSQYETAISKAGKGMAPMNIIRQRQAKWTEERQQELSSLTRREGSLIEGLNMKNKVISDLMQSYQWDYQTAQQKYQQEFNTKFQVLQYLKGEEKEEENKAQANYTVMINTVKDLIKTGKATFETLPADMQSDLRELETRTGMVRGFTDWVLKNTAPEEEIQSIITSADKTQAVIIHKDGSIRTINTGMRPEVETSEEVSIEQKLLASKGRDGFVDPGVYSSLRRQSKMGPDEFDKRYKSLLSSQERKNLGLEETEKKYTATTVPQSLRQELIEDIKAGFQLDDLITAYPEVSSEYINSLKWDLGY